MLGFRGRFASILALLAAAQTPVYAQLTAQLAGVIRDTTGAIIQGSS